MEAMEPVARGPSDLELIELARQARERAYAPYSHFAVGAALVGRSGRIFTASNVENAAYPLCTCAERAAVARAVSDGEREFVTIAVVTENGATPCGACRQILREFSGPHGDLRVLVADTAGRVRTFSLAQLLPEAFTSEQLV